MAGSVPVIVDTTWPVTDTNVYPEVRYYKYCTNGYCVESEGAPDGWFCSCYGGYDMSSDTVVYREVGYFDNCLKKKFNEILFFRNYFWVKIYLPQVQKTLG